MITLSKYNEVLKRIISKIYITSFTQQLRQSKIIPQEHNIGVKNSLCVIPDYNLSLYLILSKSIQYFLSQFVTNLHTYILTQSHIIE